MHEHSTESPIGRILAELNEQQRTAVLHDDGPLLVVAGAGTGKTATLAHRVAHRIAMGADPGRILLLTFTRRAAGEMLRRVDEILRRLETETSSEAEGSRTSAAPASRAPASGKVWGGTFHAIANRLLRLHGRAIGLDPSFTILDRADAEDLMGLLRSELGLAKSDRRFPLKSTCMDVYSRCVNARESVELAVEQHFPWCTDEAEDLRRLFEHYVDHKQERAVLDYDDLLLFWHGLLTDPGVAASIRTRFDHVLVDEYQDTNRLQAEILQLLSPGGANLTVVGDDAQAIYSFRAATVHNILDFPQQFPGTRVVTLEQNYRSTQPILETTNEVIAGASERHPKNLWSSRHGGAKPQFVSCTDENEQTEFVCRSVLQHREAGLNLRRQAVLFRASHHSLTLELELARRNIPFRKYGGLRFVETAHVKDLLAFLRLAENPKDLMAGTRVLMLLPGVGPKKARTLMDALAADTNAWATSPAPSPAAGEAWPQLVELMAALSSNEPGDLASQLKRIRLFYAPLMERLYDNSSARLMDLEQLEWLAGRYPDRERFLTEITLDPPSYTGDLAGPPLLDEDFLILSTMHSAKGLEWDAVFVIHAADGNIPSDMATGRLEEIEEERRLFYVALTRAKDWLHVCYPLRYYVQARGYGDTHGYAQPTRFVPARVRGTMESVAALDILEPDLAGEGRGDTRTALGAVTTEDIRQRLKALL
jgi:DNA helicase-2/ATP-dependent DNA helicase PcrA